MIQTIILIIQIKIDYFYNLKPKTKMNNVLNKNFFNNKLIKSAFKFVKSVTKINSKL